MNLPSSNKGKGRRAQQWIRDVILSRNPELEPDDVRSTSMGAGGEDVTLSPAARKLVPYQIESKNLARIAVYKLYQQAKDHGSHEPLLIIKQLRSKPLAVLDAEVFFDLVRLAYASTSV